MPTKKRRSDRISAELPIVISGVDVLGENFADPGRTIVIARYGAKILTYRKLTPELEILIQCLMTKEESEARVLGQIREGTEGIYYGLELLDQQVNLWGVEFPPIEESKTAVGRALMECTRCRNRELVYLNEFEAEVLGGYHSLWRFCKKCSDTNLWKETWIQAGEELPQEITGAAPATPTHLAPPKRTRNDRKSVRLELHMKALIRDPQAWEEVVVTEDISRGGLRFTSKKHYGEGWKIEVALPYSPGGHNVFSMARIKHAMPVPGTQDFVYGAAYIPWQDAWVDG
ncbi:MAG TPA: PilZ domain-containing protein [Terriglobia bacterium]|nr:PilZ domain-containing protein [Terriglobia bacterium]